MISEKFATNFADRGGIRRAERGRMTGAHGGSERSLLIEDAAAVLGVSRRTVYYRIREGRLRTIRTRCGSQRVLVSSIEALLREMTDGARLVRRRAAGAGPPSGALPGEGSESEALAFQVEPLA